MARRERVPFHVGEEVECTTFMEGYRGAWFRGKILEWKRPPSGARCLVRYLDFTDRDYSHKLYQVVPNKRPMKRMMVRPAYPLMVAPADPKEVSKLHSFFDRDWAVGDHADYVLSGAFWECMVIEMVSAEVVKIRCPDFPFGEGGDYQVCKNELRPGLQWSMESGWSVKKNTLMPELPPLVNLESPAFATRREERHKLSPKVASMITDSGPDESSTSSAPCAAENENAAADQGFLDEQTTSDEEELEDMSTLGEMVEKVRFMRDVLEYGMRGCLALRSQVDWEIVANQ
ncbi:uncharacterized protein LOC112343510 isoform X2 [Selaginella moellendorffii]|uniref:uncharacterized protein LOC112343510 isoform X2 n=1 Tax=Selaginella moellendorffii TaxID=88036 RepID=UPI000D1C28A2|nr:uncharacterized protein LOC112343510 isoform X2 [Selaginella moellendorffii]|eukprot:XP_024522885.1 uncharacterized protein LOC112343510 isoform X2 [Selaginella moellendorffii]